MNRQPYYYDPFAPKVPKETQWGEPTDPSQGQYQSSQGQYQPPQGQYQPPQGQYQPPQGQYQPPQGQYQPPQGQYQPPPYYTTGANNQPHYQQGSYTPYRYARAPVLDDKAMDQINNANRERIELVKKGNSAGAIILLFILFGTIISLLPKFLNLESIFATNSFFASGFYIFFSVFAVGGAGLLATHQMRKKSDYPILVTKKMSAKKIGFYVILGVTGCFFANIVASVFSSIVNAFGFETVMASDPPVNSILALLVSLVATAVMPAIVEECVFRAGLMQPLRKHGELLAILLSAFVFAILHQNLVQIPFAFLAGLILAFVTIKTGNILPAMIIHFINNGFSVLVGYLNEQYSEAIGNTVYYVAIFSFIAISIVFVAFLFMKGRMDLLKLDHMENLHRSYTNPYDLSIGKKVKAFISAPVMIVAIIFVVLQTVLTLKFVG